METLRRLALTLAGVLWLHGTLYAQQSTNFIYDPTGRRLEKTSGGVRTSFIMGGAYETTSGGGITKYIHGPGGLVASVTAGGTALPAAPATYAALKGSTTSGLPQGIRYSHSDHLGSASVLTNSTGTEVARYLYRPYGELIRSNSTGQDATRHKFTGQEQDDETNQQYYIARYRDPMTTLWLSADDRVTSEDILGYNRFAYVRGNPVRYTDPDGHKELEIIAVDIHDPKDKMATAALNHHKDAVSFSNPEELVRNVLERLGSEDRISILTVYSHGTEFSFRLGDKLATQSSIAKYEETFAPLRERFAKEGAVHLRSCRAGNDRRLLQESSRIFGAKVYATTEDNFTYKDYYQGDVVGATPTFYSRSQYPPLGWLGTRFVPSDDLKE